MPVSRDEFEQEQVDLALPLYALLTSNPDLAFTADELLQMLVDTSRGTTLGDVYQALGSLVNQERVQLKEFDGQRWYTVVRRRLGFRGR